MIGIIGAGAAGLSAAISAASAGADVTVLEKNPRAGRKLAATGNGRCNLTNLFAAAEKYVSSSPAELQKALDSLSPEGVRRFFASLGLPTRAEEEGRVYPCCGLAGAVVDVLRLAAAERGVVLRTDSSVKSVRPAKRGFSLLLENGDDLRFGKLVVAAGSGASAKNGGSEDGFKLLASLGHTILPISPALTPLCTETELIRPLKGIRADCGLSAYCGDSLLRFERGEALFTEYGLSGIAAMQLSTLIARTAAPVTVSMDFFPDTTASDLLENLKTRRADFPNRVLPEWTAGLLHRRIAEALFKRSGLPLLGLSGDLSDGDLSSLASCMKAFSLRCTGVKPFEYAQATAGGACLREFDPKTMESLLIPGLYAAGEVLDAAGDCGGYNLHWAWVTGITAGRASASNV